MSGMLRRFRTLVVPCALGLLLVRGMEEELRKRVPEVEYLEAVP